MKALLNAIFKSQRQRPEQMGRLGDMPIFTDYVLNRLRSTKWEDRGTIRDLIEIEQHVICGTRTASTARARSCLQRQYPDETAAITSELITHYEVAERAKRNKTQEEAAQRRRVKTEAKEKEDEERIRRQWVDLGGQT